ncbi:hypothetical protein K443DRAFT_685820 [Laccaria amethystina LaAM-08-1]|uniref:Uncharacterized protein n=1 Tax=Laccaria amethystina LaAM-08-1 TaxID=1095629 RepID=A0A0C9X5A0_9AGAR|nr:hypothetical protein K443DRAFT_685820 [Laccaria amethystina LaAM-08-1]
MEMRGQAWRSGGKVETTTDKDEKESNGMVVELQVRNRHDLSVESPLTSTVSSHEAQNSIWNFTKNASG